jgi:cytosine deaminase
MGRKPECAAGLWSDRCRRVRSAAPRSNALTCRTETTPLAKTFCYSSGARLTSGQVVDVRLRGGLIEGVGAAGPLPPAAERLDLSGYLLLPAPAEPHAHFDTALTADRVPNPTGDLAGAITAWLDYQGSVTRDDFVGRATEAALLGLANGTTAIRTHVGIYETVGTKAVEALLEVREAL